MRVLAIETTGRTGDVAVFAEGQLVAERPLEPQQRSAQSLAPAIQSILSLVGWRPGDVELVAVPKGPGSFTSLRVGIVTAKLLAYATGAQVLGVDSLGAVAEGVVAKSLDLSVAMDAYRGQVFVRDFVQDSPGVWSAKFESRIEDLEGWLNRLSPGMAVAGGILDRLLPRLRSDLEVAPAAQRNPTAAQVGRLALSEWGSGRRDDVWRLAPLYLRPSAAEEKLAK